MTRCEGARESDLEIFKFDYLAARVARLRSLVREDVAFWHLEVQKNNKMGVLTKCFS